MRVCYVNAGGAVSPGFLKITSAVTCRSGVVTIGGAYSDDYPTSDVYLVRRAVSVVERWIQCLTA